jgi:hypothetical protein
MATPDGKKTGGRRKGTPNKSTEAAKLVLTHFVARNMEDMQTLYEEIRKEKPEKAFDVLFSALEYCLPKLSRVEGNVETTFSLDGWVNDQQVAGEDRAEG